MCALNSHIGRVLEERNDCELLRVSCKIGLGFLKLSIEILGESELVVMSVLKLSVLAGFICFSFSILKASSDGYMIILDFVARFDDLHCNVAVLDLWVCNTLDIATLNFIKGNNLIILTVIISNETINEFLASLLGEFSFFKVAKEE